MPELTTTTQAGPGGTATRNCCWPRDSFNLLAAMALRAGLRIDPGELRAEIFVVAARPQHGPSTRRIMLAAPGADG